MTHSLCSDSQLSTPNKSYWNLFKSAFSPKEILFWFASSNLPASQDKYTQQYTSQPPNEYAICNIQLFYKTKAKKKNNNYNPKILIWLDLKRQQQLENKLQALTVIWNVSHSKALFSVCLRLSEGSAFIRIADPYRSEA